jgi:hypothetical protein
MRPSDTRHLTLRSLVIGILSHQVHDDAVLNRTLSRHHISKIFDISSGSSFPLSGELNSSGIAICIVRSINRFFAFEFVVKVRNIKIDDATKC